MSHRTHTRTGHTTARAVTLAVVVAAALFASVSAAHATDAGQACLKGRYDAAAKYASCHQKGMGKFFAGSYPDAGAYYSPFQGPDRGHNRARAAG